MECNPKLARAHAPWRVALDYSGPMRLAHSAGAPTPLQAAAAVAALGALALAVSQFLDYRSVAVGTVDYSAQPGAAAVAPAPQVERDAAGSAHAYLLLPVALAALVALRAALVRRRPGPAWLVAGLGAASVVVALAVDVPAGLDEGAAAGLYEGVRASLAWGFWVELCAAVALAGGGALVARRLREESP